MVEASLAVIPAKAGIQDLDPGSASGVTSLADGSCLISAALSRPTRHTTAQNDCPKSEHLMKMRLGWSQLSVFPYRTRPSIL
jgi:hypothetical protein